MTTLVRPQACVKASDHRIRKMSAFRNFIAYVGKRGRTYRNGFGVDRYFDQIIRLRPTRFQRFRLPVNSLRPFFPCIAQREEIAVIKVQHVESSKFPDDRLRPPGTRPAGIHFLNPSHQLLP